LAATRKEYHLNARATFWIMKYEPFLSVEILGDLQVKFLGPLAAFMESGDSDASPQEKSKYIMEGIDKLSKNLTGADLVSLSRLVLNGDYISVSVDNEPAEKLTDNMLNRAIDDVSEMIELVLEVVKVNYQNVFTLGLARIGRGTLNTAKP
jgi:hypothetical protein